MPKKHAESNYKRWKSHSAARMCRRDGDNAMNDMRHSALFQYFLMKSGTYCLAFNETRSLSPFFSLIGRDTTAFLLLAIAT